MKITEHAARPDDVRAFRRLLGTELAVLVIVVLTLIAVSGSTATWVFIAALVVVLLALVGLRLARAGLGRRHAGAAWEGIVLFDEQDFEDPSLYDALVRRDTGPWPRLGRKGLTGGRLSIGPSGLSWTSGGVLSPAGRVRGSFFVPFDSIVSIDVSDIPLRTRWLDAAVRIYLNDSSHHLYGELSGSRRALLAALRASPLGSGA
jgi:hypothetical protein